MKKQDSKRKSDSPVMASMDSTNVSWSPSSSTKQHYRKKKFTNARRQSSTSFSFDHGGSQISINDGGGGAQKSKPVTCGEKRSRLLNAITTKPHLFIIFMFSIFGCCYHFSLALKQYLQYSTTVTFSYEEPERHRFDYPSSTVCFRTVVPYYRLIEKYPEYERIALKLNETIKEKNFTEFWRQRASGLVINITGVTTGEKLHPYFEQLLFRNKSIADILTNYGPQNPASCRLKSKPCCMSNRTRVIKKCEEVQPVIESINGHYRCYTYFSQLDWRSLSTGNETREKFMTTSFEDLNTFDERDNRVYFLRYPFNYRNLSHPFDQELRAELAIHPPNQMMVPDFYHTLYAYEYFRVYGYYYQRTISHLLEKPYHTDCRKYELGHSKAIQSFDDCQTKCMIRFYRAECRCLPQNGMVYRLSILKPDDMFCSKENPCRYKDYQALCSQECRPDCLQQKYQAEKFSDISFFDNWKMSTLVVFRKPVPDSVYRHSPSMSFIQLICDFGGLGGLWLGFSVITTTTAIISMLRKPLGKPIKRIISSSASNLNQHPMSYMNGVYLNNNNPIRPGTVNQGFVNHERRSSMPKF